MQSVFSALAHPERRAILQLLKHTPEMAAGDIANHVPFTKPTLSHHLGVLADAGLLHRRRDGLFLLYSLNLTVLQEATQFLFELAGVHHVETPPSTVQDAGDSTSNHPSHRPAPPPSESAP